MHVQHGYWQRILKGRYVLFKGNVNVSGTVELNVHLTSVEMCCPGIGKNRRHIQADSEAAGRPAATKAGKSIARPDW